MHPKTALAAERVLLFYNRKGLVGNPDVLEMVLGRKATSFEEWVRGVGEGSGREREKQAKRSAEHWPSSGREATRSEWHWGGNGGSPVANGTDRKRRVREAWSCTYSEWSRAALFPIDEAIDLWKTSLVPSRGNALHDGRAWGVITPEDAGESTTAADEAVCRLLRASRLSNS